MSIVIISTFPNNCFEVYAKQMVQAYSKFWPEDIPLLVQLDDDLLAEQVGKLIRPQDAIAVGWTQDHLDFVNRNKANDDPHNYRKQTTRFCHKVFAIKRAYDAIKAQKETGGEAPRYLVWMDADVITTRKVLKSEIEDCLPKDAAVSYLGRKDWPHSECGWLAFDLENGGGEYIDVLHGLYISDQILKLEETHDSWAFDHIRKSKDAPKAHNLTEDKPSMDIWPHSPMGNWSVHYKGPVAKQKAAPQQRGGMTIVTKNAVPHEQIRSHIAENQKLITNWIRECLPTDEEIVIVSAGPQMYPEDVLEDYNKGKKIVAVKHALEPLRSVGIKPWASILLDPRPHVSNFVENPDKDVLWFVASQVDPEVTKKLILAGCTVWGYHASVGADEGPLTALQSDAVISGGSATATRGLFVLKHLGFRKLKLFGYDLCYPDKPDMEALDTFGQPKYLEISVGWNHPLSNLKRCFWSEPQLIAQFEEINNLIGQNIFEIEAVGEGIVPFVLKSKRMGELRQSKLRANISKIAGYDELLWNNPKKTSFSIKSLKTWLCNLLRMKKAKQFLTGLHKPNSQGA